MVDIVYNKSLKFKDVLSSFQNWPQTFVYSLNNTSIFSTILETISMLREHHLFSAKTVVVVFLVSPGWSWMIQQFAMAEMALIEIDGLPGFTVLNSMVDLSMAMLVITRWYYDYLR